MHSRKQISAQLAIIDQRLKRQQIIAAQHENYLHNLMSDNRVFFLAATLSVYVGWRLAKGSRVGDLIKQALKWGMVVAINSFKSNLLYQLTTPRKR